MKKSVCLFLLVFSLVFSFASDAKYQNTPDKDVFQTDPYGHLKYFGFYASAMGGWNFTQEISPFTNLTWIAVWTNQERVKRIRQAKEVNVKAVLDISRILFGDNSDPCYLRDTFDIEEELIDLRARLEEEDLMDSLAVIFTKDEPYRECKRHRDLDWKDEYVDFDTMKEIYQILDYSARMAKDVFPEVAIGVNFSGYDLFDPEWRIPESYDWIGYDCYQNLFESCRKGSAKQIYYKLLNYMKPHQKLFAIPEVWAADRMQTMPDGAKILMQRLKHHYEIALAEPRFVAVVPFIYSFDVTSGADVPGKGLNRIPEIFDTPDDPSGTEFYNYVVDMGMQIKYGEHVYPNMAYEETENVEDRSSQNVKGQIMTINRRGLISAWAYDYALQHKNLRVQVKIKDPSGNVIHSSPVERTFILDRNLIHKRWIDRAQIGSHGYRYQIPQSILDQYKGKTIGIDFITYKDGEGLPWGHTHSRNFRIWRPGVRFPNRPFTDQRDYYYRRFGRRLQRP
jgi:hypothetical protein